MIARTIPQAAAPLRVTFVGHINHGKSTLIGRLLHDADALTASARTELERLSLLSGRGGLDYALATDRLLEERERRITIDTSRTAFYSDRREYEVIDAPGHPRLIKNMLSGATSADVAVLIVDAEESLREQTTRHAMLLRLVGVTRVLVAVNKLDRFGFDEDVFWKVVGDIQLLLSKVGVLPFATVPVSAREGDNVVTRSVRTPWYAGPTVLEALDGLERGTSEDHPMRFTVQDVVDFDHEPLILGRVESGRVAAGEPILVMPADRTVGVRAVLTMDGSFGEAESGDCPGLRIDNPRGIMRGDVLSDPIVPPPTSSLLRVTVFWMHGQVEASRREPVGIARIATQTVPVWVREITRRFDSSTLREQKDRTRLACLDVAEVNLEFARPVVFEHHRDFPPLGRFTIETGREVVAAGIVRGRATRGG